MEHRRDPIWLYLLTIKATLRRKVVSLILVAAAALGIVASCGLHGLLLRQEAALLETQQNTTIHCVVTDPRGISSERLGMASSYVEALLGYREDQGVMIHNAVKNVRSSAMVELEVPRGWGLCRVLDQQSDDTLCQAELRYYPGWDESVFSTKEMVCFVPEGMQCETSSDGTEYIVVEPKLLNLTVKLTVAGRIIGGNDNTIYCPFLMPWEKGVSTAFSVDYCTFDIKDTVRLEECRELLFSSMYFTEPNLNNRVGDMAYGVLVQDEIYLAALEEIQSNIDMLRLLQPILLLMVGAISCFASYMTTRSRQKEFAVMRCLGMGRGKIFGIVFFEQTVLAFLGGVIGLFFGWLLDGQLEPGALAKAGAVIAVFLIGAGIAAIRVTAVNVMKLMKVED